MKKAGYSEFDDFVKDVAQIFYNAKLYNSRGSEVFEDACTLEVITSDIALLTLGSTGRRTSTTSI